MNTGTVLSGWWLSRDFGMFFSELRPIWASQLSVTQFPCRCERVLISLVKHWRCNDGRSAVKCCFVY